MTFKEYQEKAHLTADYLDIVIPDHCSSPDHTDVSFIYATLGLCGESGEVAEKVKKIIRDKQGIITDVDRIQIAKELGDVLWHVAEIATKLDLNLQEIAYGNIAKLQEREEKGTIHGSGDNR